MCISSLKKTSKKRACLYLASLVCIIWYLFCLPSPLFTTPSSTVIEDRNGELLGARIATDEQWRLSHSNELPDRFVQSLLTFEDQYFHYHFGINPLSLIRAIYQDIKARRIVSGGSTISMQLIRLSRGNKARNIYQKTVEIILATRLELRYSKQEILELYAANAPFGGNIVGLEAAVWRYYNRPPSTLSWAEAATLAVLPNAPSLIYPGKNNQALLEKRNRLLKKLLDAEKIDSTTYELSLLESLPNQIHKLPSSTPHLLDQLHKTAKGKRTRTSIDLALQKEVNFLIKNHSKQLVSNQIHNAAVIVMDIGSGEVLSYVGNSPALDTLNEHGNSVDIIRANRSSGSILKPLLFADMIQQGTILPKTIIPDIPTQIGSYRPLNFDSKYDGVVSARKALYRSLNIPAVHMLRMHHHMRFHNTLQQLGFSSITEPAHHYGLSIILGGAETSLWEIAGVYASMARTLNHYTLYDGRYTSEDWRMPSVLLSPQNTKKPSLSHQATQFDAASIYATFEALREVYRPETESGWQLLSSSRKIAWKTGTSFGFRDAWAIGTTPEYLVGVWVGNADGEGRPGLTGVEMAAPLMFDVFKLLPSTSWFKEPSEEFVSATICEQSGYRANAYCENLVVEPIHPNGLNTKLCPYHHLLHLDAEEQFQVTSHCEDPDQMVHKSWFVLPPSLAHFYQKKNPLYKTPPPFHPDCSTSHQKTMELLYPKENNKIYIPRNLTGSRSKIIFEAVHQNKESQIFWHLNETFIGSTTDPHQLVFTPASGKHTLTLVDEKGEILTQQFEITSD